MGDGDPVKHESVRKPFGTFVLMALSANEKFVLPQKSA